MLCILRLGSSLWICLERWPYVFYLFIFLIRVQVCTHSRRCMYQEVIRRVFKLEGHLVRVRLVKYACVEAINAPSDTKLRLSGPGDFCVWQALFIIIYSKTKLISSSVELVATSQKKKKIDQNHKYNEREYRLFLLWVAEIHHNRYIFVAVYASSLLFFLRNMYLISLTKFFSKSMLVHQPHSMERQHLILTQSIFNNGYDDLSTFVQCCNVRSPLVGIC